MEFAPQRQRCGGRIPTLCGEGEKRAQARLHHSCQIVDPAGYGIKRITARFRGTQWQGKDIVARFLARQLGKVTDRSGRVVDRFPLVGQHCHIGEQARRCVYCG